MDYFKTPDILTSPQIRLFLIGPPKFGKTFSACSFPGPIVIDFDNGLTSPDLRAKNIKFMPMYDKKFVTEQMKQQNSVNALTWFLTNDAAKLTNQQTIILDSVSTIGDAVMAQLEKMAPVGKTGEKDGFWIWKMWAEWWRTMVTQLTTLSCHVVVCAHEVEHRDAETGRLLGYKWLMKGQDFSPRMAQFFTDVFRQTKKSTEANGKVKEEYMWQVKADNLFPFACSRMSIEDKLIPANFAELKKHYKF